MPDGVQLSPAKTTKAAAAAAVAAAAVVAMERHSIALLQASGTGLTPGEVVLHAPCLFGGGSAVLSMLHLRRLNGDGGGDSSGR